MARLTKAQQAERAQAIEDLKELYPKGSTVYCLVESVSRSGMSRVIRVLAPKVGDDGQVYFLHPNYLTATALGWPLKTSSRDGIRVDGCGMDMCFHLVYSLAHVLYGDGYALKTETL